MLLNITLAALAQIPEEPSELGPERLVDPSSSGVQVGARSVRQTQPNDHCFPHAEPSRHLTDNQISFTSSSVCLLTAGILYFYAKRYVNGMIM